MNKNSRWCFTAWQRPNCRKQELIMFEVWQREKTSEGRIHYQGYVEFFKPYTQSQVKNLYSQKNMHLEEPKESRERNMMYCLKPKSYLGERFMYNGPGDLYHETDKSYFDKITWDDIFKK